MACLKRYARNALSVAGVKPTLLVWMLVCCVSAVADTLTLSEATKEYHVDKGVRFFVDTDDMSVDDVVKLLPEDWTRIDGGINFGYSKKTYWFALNVTSAADQPLDRLLQIAYALLDYVDVYVYSSDQLLWGYSAGDVLPFRHRPIKHRYFTFPMTFAPSQQYEIYIRAQTSGALQLPLIFWEERSLYQEDLSESIINAIYCGILFAMAVLNLLLFFTLRDRSYLYYVFFLVSVFLLMISIYGYGFQYLYPEYPKFHGTLILLIVPISQISISMFVAQFLQLEKNSIVLHRVFQFFVFSGVICLVCSLIIPYSILIKISVISTLPLSLAALWAGIYFWRAGNSSAKLFTIAWVTFLLGAISIVINRLGLFDSVFILEQAMPLGTSAQTILFTLALASRFNSERDARMKAQSEHLEEIRKRREAETQILYVANHHDLTGLPNRLLFEKALRPHIINCADNGKSLVVVLLHVRRFDDVNKTLGHRNADILLHKIGERVDGVLKGTQGCVPVDARDRSDIYTAHVEGVSFCFAMISDSEDAAIVEVEECLRLMTRPIEFMGLSLEPSFIVGCSFSQGKHTDPPSLLRESFIAFDMANSKLSPISIYEPEMNPYSPKRLTLMTELRSALEFDGLNLFFQPQIRLSSGRVCGFEALLRWTHHEYGFVPPDEFIPMAEKTGLMKPLTQWVIKRALVFCKQLDNLNCEALISVNISALNLREPDFCQNVKDTVDRSGVDPKRLILEVTETAAMSNPEAALSTLNQLYNAGFRLSMDDFGTGHSSLSYIRRLPVHEIKIDRSFVGEMNENKGDMTIVKTTINMCHDLGYEVVAEGVENRETLDMLQSMECDVIQGYYIAKPMEQLDVIEWLQVSEWFN